MVKQGNQVVEFLKKLEVDIDEEYGIEAPPSFSDTIGVSDKKLAPRSHLVKTPKYGRSAQYFYIAQG